MLPIVVQISPEDREMLMEEQVIGMLFMFLYLASCK